jgi:hypothetical protein
MAWEGSANPKVEQNQWAKDCLMPMGEHALSLLQHALLPAAHG